jgi:hypothetical protein
MNIPARLHFTFGRAGRSPEVAGQFAAKEYARNLLQAANTRQACEGLVERDHFAGAGGKGNF